MRKTLRFVALAAVMALTSWLSTHPTAQAALPSCDNINGTSCNPAVHTGRAKCYWYGAAQEPGFCTCNAATSTWQCCCIS